MRQQSDLALAEIDQAVALAPGEPLYLLMRAQMHSQAGRPEEARTDLGRALRLAPDDPNTILPNALELLDRGALEEARELLSAATRRNPGQEQLIWAQGLTLLKLEQPGPAREVFLRLIAHAKLSGSPFQLQGQVGLALSEPPGPSGSSGPSGPSEEIDRGAAAWTLAASADPLMTIDTSSQLMMLGFEKQLRELAGRAAKLAPEHLDVGYVQAEILRQTGFSDQAVAVVERLLEQDPARPRALQLLITAAVADGDSMRFASARERLRAALDLDPGALNALSLLAQAVVTGKGNADDLEDLLTRIDTAREKLRGSRRALALLDQLEQQIRQ